MNKFVLCLVSLSVLIQQGCIATVGLVKAGPALAFPYIGTRAIFIGLLGHFSVLEIKFLLLDLPFTFSLETLVLPFTILRLILYGY